MAQTKTPEVEDKYFDARWYKAKIQQPLRSIIFQASLVEPAAGGDKRVPENLGFPDSAYKQEDQLTLWSFIYDMYPSVVCKKAHIHQWLKVSWRDWKRITPKEIANKIANKKGLTGLAKVLGKDRTETIEWLNSFYAFIVENNEESVFTKIAVIPNQKGDFRTSRELFIDAIDDSTLVKILRLLGDDWEEVLIEQAVFIEDLREKTKQDIANEITEQLKEIKNVRTSLAVEQKASIMILSDWFDHNDENLSTKLFQFWYSRKHELFVSTIEEKEKEIISELIRDGNLEQVSALAKKLKENPDISLEDLQNDELSSILDKHGLKSVEELDAVLAQAKDSEIFEQMKAILQNENYRDIFGHISNPKYFPYAQKKLARVRERVREHLTGLDGYNLDSAQYMGDTIIGGVKKDGQDTLIITRPSDGGFVIIYYDNERDVLDYDASSAELWVEDGNSEPKQLTFGKILKMTGIIKFPMNESKE
jgi:arsenate reductase-like glutaredoxin family protein